MGLVRGVKGGAWGRLAGGVGMWVEVGGWVGGGMHILLCSWVQVLRLRGLIPMPEHRFTSNAKMLGGIVLCFIGDGAKSKGLTK